MPDVKKKVSRRAVLKWAGLGTIALGASQINNRNELTVERSTLRLPRWDAEGFKIALLTDLHMDSRSKADRGLRAARLAVAEKPDVILIGGDLASTSKEASVQACLRTIQAILEYGIPTYAVLGNHEYWVHDVPGLVSTLARSMKGRRSSLLRNETAVVDGVVIAGVDDGIAGRDRHQFLHSAHDKNVVTLFHEPDFVTRVDRRASVMLAGHSHGGQVCLPFGIPVHTPRGARTYIKGFFPQAPVPLYVSRGVGTVGPSVRVFCPPEISILTLVSA